MKTTPLLIGGALLVLVTLAPGQATRSNKKSGKNERERGPAAATPVPVKEEGYALFHMVRQKNIFDPDRRPMPVEGAPKAPPPTVSSGPRASYLTLTGTMVTETKRLAFFSGSHSEYNKVVGAHEKLGDVEIETISTSHVDLKRGDQAIVLAVGKQLTLGDRSGGGAATVSSTPAPTEDAPSTPPTVSSLPATASVPSATPTADVGNPLDPAAIARRMMERRLKEK